jgi:hypothetical protein
VGIVRDGTAGWVTESYGESRSVKMRERFGERSDNKPGKKTQKIVL